MWKNFPQAVLRIFMDDLRKTMIYLSRVDSVFRPQFDLGPQTVQPLHNDM